MIVSSSGQITSRTAHDHEMPCWPGRRDAVARRVRQSRERLAVVTITRYAPDPNEIDTATVRTPGASVCLGGAGALVLGGVAEVGGLGLWRAEGEGTGDPRAVTAGGVVLAGERLGSLSMRKASFSVSSRLWYLNANEARTSRSPAFSRSSPLAFVPKPRGEPRDLPGWPGDQPRSSNAQRERQVVSRRLQISHSSVPGEATTTQPTRDVSSARPSAGIFPPRPARWLHSLHTAPEMRIQGNRRTSPTTLCGGCLRAGDPRCMR